MATGFPNWTDYGFVKPISYILHLYIITKKVPMVMPIVTFILYCGVWTSSGSFQFSISPFSIANLVRSARLMQKVLLSIRETRFFTVPELR